MHGLTFAMIVACVLMFVLHYLQPTQTFYSVDAEEEYIQLRGLDEPNVTTKTLLRWATLAATSAYTLNFHEWETNLDKLHTYFTVAGYKNFRSALDESGFLKEIIDEKLIVAAVNSIRPTIETPSATPVILQEGITKGRYTWTIQLPLLVNFQGSSETSTSRYYVVTMLVSRVPTEEARKGIGIAQFSAKQMS